MCLFVLLFICKGVGDLDINQEKNPMKIFGTIFLIVSIVVIGVSFSTFYNAFNFNSNAQRTEAIISNIAILKDKNGKEYYDTLVNYTVSGKQYNNISLNTSVNNKKKGDTIDIFYNKLDNTSIRISLKPYYLSIFLFSMGIALLVSAFMAVRRLNYRKNEIYNLILENNFIYANIKDIQNNFGLRFGTRSPIFIKCEYNDGNKNITFDSDNIWLPIKKDIIQKQVKVFIDNNDMNKYYVDTRDLYDLEENDFAGK